MSIPTHTDPGNAATTPTVRALAPHRPRGRAFPANRPLLLVVGAFLLTSGCASNGNLEQSRIYRETLDLEKALTNSSGAGAAADTVFLAGFPRAAVDCEGGVHTVFTLGRPAYSPGIDGMVITSFDPATGRMSSHRTPPMPATVSIKHGDRGFAVPGRLPILKRRVWLFFTRPHLYHFPAVLTPVFLDCGGEELRIAEFARVHGAGRWSTLAPPALPAHLQDLDGKVVFIAEDSYKLGGPGATVPSDFRLDFDHAATRKLYSRLRQGEFDVDSPWKDADLQRLERWLTAYPVYEDALAYYSGTRTPFFVGFDHPYKVWEERLRKSSELAGRAAGIDDHWQAPRRLRASLEKETADLPAVRADGGVHGKKFVLGLGVRGQAYGNAYSGPYDKKLWAGVLAVFGHLQVARSLAVTLGTEPLKQVTEVADMAPDRGLRFDQVYLHINYQTPLRVQFGNAGTRLQLTGGVVRLSERLDVGGDHYRGTGLAADVGVSLVPRQGYGFHGKESARINKSGLVEIGYRSGKISEYTGAGGQATPVLVDREGRPVTFRPRGLWLAVNVDFLGL